MCDYIFDLALVPPPGRAGVCSNLACLRLASENERRSGSLGLQENKYDSWSSIRSPNGSAVVLPLAFSTKPPLELVCRVMDPHPCSSGSGLLNETWGSWSSREAGYLLDLGNSAHRSQGVRMWYDSTAPGETTEIKPHKNYSPHLL